MMGSIPAESGPLFLSSISLLLLSSVSVTFSWSKNSFLQLHPIRWHVNFIPFLPPSLPLSRSLSLAHTFSLSVSQTPALASLRPGQPGGVGQAHGAAQGRHLFRVIK